MTKQRFEAGITDSVEVVKSQEVVAGSELDYISAVFAHNLAKLTQAPGRAGGAEQRYAQYLGLQ